MKSESRILFSILVGVSTAFTAIRSKKVQDVRTDAIKWQAGRENAKSNFEHNHRKQAWISWVTGVAFLSIYHWSFSNAVSFSSITFSQSELIALLLSFLIGLFSAHRKYRSLFYHASHGLLKSPLTSIQFFGFFLVNSMLFQHFEFINNTLDTSSSLFHQRTHFWELGDEFYFFEKVEFAFLFCIVSISLFSENQQRLIEIENYGSAWNYSSRQRYIHCFCTNASNVIIYLFQSSMNVEDLPYYGIAYCITYKFLCTAFLQRKIETRPLTLFSLDVDGLVVNVVILLVQLVTKLIMTTNQSFVFTVAPRSVFALFIVKSPMHILISFLGLALGARTHGFLFSSKLKIQ